MPSWLHTFASACLSGRCYSPGTASYLADSQRLTGSLVYPEGLPVSLDPSSIPSYSFHGAHMECTTRTRAPGTTVLTAFDTPMHASVGYANRSGAPSYFPLSALTDHLDTRNQF